MKYWGIKMRIVNCDICGNDAGYPDGYRRPKYLEDEVDIVFYNLISVYYGEKYTDMCHHCFTRIKASCMSQVESKINHIKSGF